MLCLVSLIFAFLPTASAVVTLVTGPQTGIFVPTEVRWSRQRGDPQAFDLRFITGGADVGFAASVHKSMGSNSGTVYVSFLSEGEYELKAVDPENDNQVIATSPLIVVGPNAPSDLPLPTVSSTDTPLSSSSAEPTTTLSTTSSETSASSTTDTSATSSSSPNTVSATSASSKTPAVVGGVIATFVILGLILAIFFYLKRRRKNAQIQRRLTFNREMMVQNRYPSDLEPGSFAGTGILLNPVPQSTAVPAITTRQTQIDERVWDLEQQIAGLQRQNRGQVGMETALEQIREQVEALRAHRDSPWALGETDVCPPEIALSMQ